jgi:4,5-DOPA dioxygenase extradiol
MSTPAPLLFISHGAPTFALEPGRLGARLRGLAPVLDDVRAVLVISPHWQTPGLAVTAAARPQTLHDFGGFPAALYALRYAAPGAPEVAREVCRLLEQTGEAVMLDEQRGLDHGAWVPMMHLRPQADRPVLQLALPFAMDAAAAMRLGQSLAPIRQHGVALIGSGSLTHNLMEFRGPDVPEQPYVRDFARWIRDRVRARDAAALADYRRLAPAAERAHPTEEHLLPLHVAFGASSASESLGVLETEVRFGMLSMESYAWGGQANSP